MRIELLLLIRHKNIDLSLFEVESKASQKENYCNSSLVIDPDASLFFENFSKDPLLLKRPEHLLKATYGFVSVEY